MFRLKSILAISLVFIILLSGCPIQKEPKELYKELTQRSQNLSNGKYNYTIALGSEDGTSLGSGSGTSLISGLEMDLDVYSLNGRSKTVMSIGLLGTSMTTAVFKDGDKIVSCTESNYSSTTSSSITCEEGLGSQTMFDLYGGEYYLELFDKNLESLNIELVGENSYVGRPCHEFKITVDAETLANIYSSSQDNSYSLSSLFIGSSFKDTSLDYHVCLDKLAGFASYSKIAYLKYSELSGKETEVLNVEMELNSYDLFGVSESDLRVPISFDIKDLDCEKDRISLSLSAFNDVEGDVKVKIGKYSYSGDTTYDIERSVDIGGLGFGESKELEVNLDSDLSENSYEVAVCADEGKCSTKRCYISTYTEPEIEPPEELEDECEESDDGRNFAERGIVTRVLNGVRKVYYDKCNSDKVLVEYYCEGDIMRTRYETCTCSEGTCIEDVNTVSCKDSDGGINYHLKGIAETKDELSTGTYNDICFNDGDVLHEWFCNSNNFAEKKEYTCPNGCREGICIQVFESCEDTDGGINPDVKGTVTDNKGRKSTDSCHAAPHVVGQLLEYFCSESGSNGWTIDCPNYCEDGACK